MADGKINQSVILLQSSDSCCRISGLSSPPAAASRIHQYHQRQTMSRQMSLRFVTMLAFAAPLSYASSPDGILYSDWDGAETCKPLSFAQPTTEAAIVEEIVAAAAEGDMIKVVGAGHSFSGIQLTDGSVSAGSSGRMISLDRYAGVVGSPAWAEDGSYADVTVRAGSRLCDLNTALEALGLAFINLGSCAAQSIAGAVATGTHGTGKLLGSMSTQVVGLRLLDASGVAHDVSAGTASEADLFSAARVGLGALGVVVEVTVRCVPLFKMKETTYSLPLSDLLATHDELYENNDRFQWNWLVWLRINQPECMCQVSYQCLFGIILYPSCINVPCTRIICYFLIALQRHGGRDSARAHQ